MNNFPENEKNTEEITEDSSTIFSAPSEHRKTASDFKKKKFFPKVIAALLAVVILAGGTYAIFKLVKEKKAEEETAFKPIEVLKLNSNDFRKITVNNNNGTYNLYAKVSTSASTSSESTETLKWFIEGYNEDILSSISIGEIPENIAEVTATREVTKRTAEECGLVDTRVKAEVTDKNGKVTTYLIGNESPDKSGYYFKLLDSDKIYVVNNTLKETIDFSPVSLANTDPVSPISLKDVSSTYKSETGMLSTFDKLTISGSKISEPVTIKHLVDESASGVPTYKIIAPTIRVASDNLEFVVNVFRSGISDISGAYALDVKPATLKGLGFDSPDFEAKMEIENKVYTYKFKLQADGNYAVYSDDAKIVKMIPADAESIKFANMQTSYFYSDIITINFLDVLNAFTFKAGENTYHFEFKENPDEDAEDVFIVTLNGKSVRSMPFQTFYEDCILLKCSDFTVDELKGEPHYAITYHFIDEKDGKEVVEFVKYSATKYQYYINGYPLGKVSTSSLRLLEKSIEEMLNDINK